MTPTRSSAGSAPRTLRKPKAKRSAAVKSSPTGPREARREAVPLDGRAQRSYPNQPRPHHPNHWVRKCGCSIKGSDTPHNSMPANPLGLALRNRRAGHHTLVWARTDLQAPENFTLTSPAFDHGAAIPERHRGRLFGANISPALAWTTPPAGTAELVLIVQDPDAPRRTPATHALTIGIDPALEGIAKNGLTDPSPIPGIQHGKGALGRRGWAGPLPLRSHGPHSYAFQLFALDCHPDLPSPFTLTDALRAMSGHVIGRARLDGTYEIR
jgi:Raf kinase inhibitor-like YbhB/YbcL family protein